jgi:hypothetical protein
MEVNALSLNIQTADGLLEIGGNVKTQCCGPVIRSGRQASMRFEAARPQFKTPIGLISYRGYFYLINLTHISIKNF